MTFLSKKGTVTLAATGLILASFCLAYQAGSIPASRLISSEELAKTLQPPQNEKPIIIQVGFRSLYEQAHILGAEYVGPASSPSGLQELRKRVESLSKAKSIVIYCGCCPWSHCPNLKPAADALQALGFKNFKVLYIANNFGTDWVDKGYPVTKGQ